MGNQVELFGTIQGNDNEETGRFTERWHMYDTSVPPRTFIMYGKEESVRRSAEALGYVDVQRSGYYSFQTNTIIDAKDGPTFYEDYRTSY